MRYGNPESASFPLPGTGKREGVAYKTFFFAFLPDCLLICVCACGALPSFLSFFLPDLLCSFPPSITPWGHGHACAPSLPPLTPSPLLPPPPRSLVHYLPSLSLPLFFWLLACLPGWSEERPATYLHGSRQMRIMPAA